MLRNLAAQKEQQAHTAATSDVYDKLRMLNAGQGWPRPSPWSYPGAAAAFGGIAPPCSLPTSAAAAAAAGLTPHPTPAAITSAHSESGSLTLNDKKGKRRQTHTHTLFDTVYPDEQTHKYAGQDRSSE